MIFLSLKPLEKYLNTESKKYESVKCPKCGKKPERSNMRNSNIVKLDQKGRLLLPKHIRQFLKTDDGTEILLIPDNDNSQVKIVPLVTEKTMELRFIINDSPGSLAAVADTLSANGINIILSESRTLLKGKSAEWDIIVDTSDNNGGLDKVRNSLIESKVIKRMEVLRE